MLLTSSKMIYVLNNKLERTPREAIAWCTTHHDDLAELTQHAHIIFCPEVTMLATIGQLLPTSVALGSQQCSPFLRGAHTGSISALSLIHVNCTFCIVGHYETRRDLCIDDHTVVATAVVLLEQGITPLVCIGGASKTPSEELTYKALTQQLAPLYRALVDRTPSAHEQLCIVYEPGWAIGLQGEVPSKAYRDSVGLWLMEWAKTLPNYSIKILYGGGVHPADGFSDEHTPYSGYVLGRSGLDMQTLKKLIY